MCLDMFFGFTGKSQGPRNLTIAQRRESGSGRCRAVGRAVQSSAGRQDVREGSG